MVLAKTVTVFNNSGKVVSTSKQLVNVFKEAKAAYRERKAEIAVTRDFQYQEKLARKALKNIQLEDDNASRPSSRASRSRRDPRRAKSHRDRPPLERGYTDSVYENDHAYDHHEARRDSQQGSVRSRHTSNRINFEQSLDAPRGQELRRRHTDGEFLEGGKEMDRRHSYAHSARSSIDMDLAYGELPPPLPARKHNEEVIIREKMSKITMLLDEANALQHSATGIIEHLQKNPDAMAAVALTLAEVSNLAAKMGPGALMAMKGSFPAVVALLASPQFLIAGGLAIGVTVVMLGGFKIVQRIKEKNENERGLEMGMPMEAEVATPIELQELETGELDRIEIWRRGIADAAAQSQGSIVEGEFITPGAEQWLIDEGVLDDSKSRRSTRTKKSSRSEAGKKKKHRTSSQAGSSKAGSSRGSTAGKENGTRKKAVSGLRMLFGGHSVAA
ncbi:hypothetical protein E6O75_ATG05536 [Venturia nashicola]|uniref:Uncharacterized protein n=1 Tax=Venturia nashicola TaxID=86259 RepID=A0A4Z1PFP5_9PEZI|nr:hypothetical protein E6O75_ATG05536 [Venturia nashicola]